MSHHRIVLNLDIKIPSNSKIEINYMFALYSQQIFEILKIRLHLPHCEENS